MTIIPVKITKKLNASDIIIESNLIIKDELLNPLQKDNSLKPIANIDNDDNI
jgi:hypothetical protein